VIDSAILDAMLAAGASAEVIVAAVKADAAREDARREAQRAGNARRQRRYRDRLFGDETGDLFDGVEAGGPACEGDGLGEESEAGPGSLRHAGLVPASTVPHTLQPLSSRHGGPRNESGVTGGEGDALATSSRHWMTDGDVSNARNASHDAAPAVTGAIPPSLDKSPQTPKINPIPHAPGRDSPREASTRRFPCPAGCDPADWRDLLANRRTKRLPMTEAAYRKLIRDLAAQADDAWPPGRLLAHAAEKGWAQIFDPRDDTGTRHGNRRSRSATSRAAGTAGEPQNPLVRAVLRSEARDAGEGSAGF
jgi:hypothetical protein